MQQKHSTLQTYGKHISKFTTVNTNDCSDREVTILQVNNMILHIL